MQCTPAALVARLVALALLASPLFATGEEDFLPGDALMAAFTGATLIGSDWAEYYAPDGAIAGRVRYFGRIRHFAGRWFVKRDQVCFEYELAQYNTCSKFRREGDRMRHFAAGGERKADGESRRFPGNRLEDFR